jgi:hypothetical protein
MRADRAVVANYADLLIELSEIVPDGMVRVTGATAGVRCNDRRNDGCAL